MVDVDDIALFARGESTPYRVFRPRVAAERLDLVAQLCDVLARRTLAVVPAFSLKTNPRSELLELAREPVAGAAWRSVRYGTKLLKVRRESERVPVRTSS